MNIGTALDVLGIAASLSGVPYLGAAVAVLQEISNQCDKIAGQKSKSKQLAKKCEQLMLCLCEQTRQLEGTELMPMVDEVTSVLEKVNNRVGVWSRYHPVKAFLKSSKIENGLANCESEINNAMDTFHMSTQIAIRHTQREQEELNRSRHDEQMELLRQIAGSRDMREDIEQMQRTGKHVAEPIMEAMQLEMRRLRENLETQNGTGQYDPSSTPTLGSLYGNQYAEFQYGLTELHKLTGLPPAVKILNGEVKRQGDSPIAGGLYSDIWLGMWLGQKKVALKALRSVKTSDPKAIKRFEQEIKVWVDLRSEYILPFFGIVTNLGPQIHVVASWEENGNILEYLKDCPKANKLNLLCDVAKGLEYLHSRGVIHGNVKCSNVLVSSGGRACVCDFGMSKLVEDVTNASISVTVADTGSGVDWLAPELIRGDISSPRKETDIYSYGMTVLELITMKRPWSHVKRHSKMIHAIAIKEEIPPRPQEPQAAAWMSDGLWDLMVQCWSMDVSLRPEMGDVVNRMERIKTAH